MIQILPSHIPPCPVSQAIEDFKLAEQRGYRDLYTLMVARGNTYRQLDMPAEALNDFINASQVLGSGKKVLDS